MSFLPASRTKRNLFKIASLGLAGLLAGLLSGCTNSPKPTVNTIPSDASINAEAQPSQLSPELPKSIEATQIPALRHPPTSRSLQYGSVHTVSMAMLPNPRNHS